MTAETLRRAAALMRERAEAARPSPWNIDGPWWHDDDEIGGFDTTDMVTAAKERRPVAVTAPRDLNDNHDRSADMQHIASWHPAVALAVADWLDRAADEEWCCDECKFSPDNPQNLAHNALAVARAYLGAEGGEPR